MAEKKLVEMVGKAGRVFVTEDEVNRMKNKGYEIAPPAVEEDRTKKSKSTSKKSSEKKDS